MRFGFKSRLASTFVAVGVALAIGWGQASAVEPPAADEAPSLSASLGDDAKPSKVDKGNGKLPQVRKKRGAGAVHEQVNKELITKWFTEINLIHQVDGAGRFIIPFRDDASGLAFKVVLIPRAKGAGSTWALQTLVPLQIPLPGGDQGALKGVLFANTWNTNNFFVKASLVMPQGQAPFFLLDSAMPCEDGMSKSEFFQNFLRIVVMSTQSYANKAKAELGGAAAPGLQH